MLVFFLFFTHTKTLHTGDVKAWNKPFTQVITLLRVRKAFNTELCIELHTNQQQRQTSGITLNIFPPLSAKDGRLAQSGTEELSILKPGKIHKSDRFCRLKSLLLKWELEKWSWLQSCCNLCRVVWQIRNKVDLEDARHSFPTSPVFWNVICEDE